MRYKTCAPLLTHMHHGRGSMTLGYPIIFCYLKYLFVCHLLCTIGEG